MKKIFNYLAVLTAATLAFSCVEEANPEMSDNMDPIYEGPMINMTFSLGELETRTSYDKVNGHQWSEGDEIRIIWGSETNAWTDATIVNGQVSATVGDVDTFYAVYPAGTAYTLTEGQLSVTIPMVQDGTFKAANIMAARTTATDRLFSFRNLTHIFKFTLSEGSKHKGFSIMSNSSNVALSGTFPVTFNDTPDNPITLGTATNTSTEVRAGNLEPGGTYYLGFCPNADMSYGFGFKATKTAGVTNWSEGALTTTPITTARSEITYIPELDKAIRDNWFFKPGAKGDGSSWENAGGEELLVKLLGDKMDGDVSYNKTTNGWRLYGAEFHLSKGTYTLPETIKFHIAVNNKTEIYGGYPDNLEGTSLEGRDAAVNKTTISKNGGSRLFYGNASTLFNWTWDGITFTSTETLTERGGLLYANGNTNGNITFVNCTFAGLVTSKIEGGGAFDFNAGTATLKATFSNCKFNNCSAPQGGAIVVESGSATTLEFTNCQFIGNVAGDKSAQTDRALMNGGAIHMANGEIHLDECVFDGNSASLGAHISMISSNPKTYVNRSVFKNGTAYCKTSTDWYGSAIHSVNTNAVLCINNSIFYNNASANITLNDGLPCIRANGVKTLILNSSFAHKGLRTLHAPNGDDGGHALVINNISKNLGSKTIDMANGGTRKYNITVTNATADDTNLGDNANLSINWTEDTNTFTWSLTNVTISKWATETVISDLVSTNFAAFDSWLKSVETNPYCIDFYGNSRNPEKFNPGAWDEGLN